MTTNQQADNQLPPVICSACNTEFHGTTAIQECTAHIKTEHSDSSPDQSSDGKELDTTNLESKVFSCIQRCIDHRTSVLEASEYIVKMFKTLHQKEVDKIVEAVIGEDEATAQEASVRQIDEAVELAERSKLRQEQRKRYEALKRGGKL